MSNIRKIQDNDDAIALTPEELEHFRLLLVQRRESVEKDSKSEWFASSERPPDESDVASNESQAAFDSRLQDRASAHLKKIDKALTRIEDGEYDECESCGDYIAAARLKARPEATLCIGCKEEEELRERAYA